VAPAGNSGTDDPDGGGVELRRHRMCLTR